MKRILALFPFVTVLLFMLGVVPVMADDDVMITRDGSMIPVKVEVISTSEVTFVDLKHKKRGRQKAPADFVYMILKEKGSNIFFDEEGNQMTSPVVKFDKKKDNVIFLNRCEMYVIYNISVGKDEVKYQLKDKKKAPWETIKKSEIFMILNSDGTTTLYNNAYQEKRKKSVSAINSPQNAPTTLMASSAMPVASKPSQVSASSSIQSSTVPSGQQLVTANMDQTQYTPAPPEMSPTDLEMAVNAVNPYILYRKGSMVEYRLEYNGKPAKVGFIKVPTAFSGYLRQIVEDEKIVNGQLVTFIRQEEYNSKHELSKWIPNSYKERVFQTEIDPSGTYHFTHNLGEDRLTPIEKRQGYGLLVPGNMQPGMQLQSSTLYDVAKGALGTFKRESVYSNWKVIGEEQVETPVGTFNCMKLTGKISVRLNKEKKYTEKNITCWMARGIGIVRYERTLRNDNGSEEEPLIFYLNAIDLK